MSEKNKPEGHDPHSILLQSKDHAELLDVIDLLRSQGISHYVSLPQLIVCGDQSSGKSSVLEAVSGVSFPTKDNLCTRFATELVLRRASEENAAVAITPGADRTNTEKAKLREFERSKVSMEDVPLLINKAKEAMGLTDDTKAFSDDVLRVEISGPRQPNLTLVDLPGLIHAENKQQSAKDVKLVSSLVRSYMRYPRSIILAVVSAKNDYANQVVTQLARRVDPEGLRTLGVITKPDTLHAGSDSEKAFVDLAKNGDVSFRLGWHVLRNRDYNNRECSVAERDKAEKDFFSSGIWNSLPIKSVGIGSLKPRLSAVLREQIIHELPKLIRELGTGIEECRNRLDMLGDARETIPEQRLYLMRISQTFSTLVKAAVDGQYAHDFFGDAMTAEGSGKRLRATIQNLLLDFAEDMRREGHEQEIVEDSAKGPLKARAPVTSEADSDFPTRISKRDYIGYVQELMKESRGRELPGTFNPLIIGDLFYKQAKPWKELVDRNCEMVLQIASNCLGSILSHTTDKSTRDGLLLHVIGPATQKCKEKLEAKVAEIMRPHQTGHPITYNRYFTETIQRARQEHNKKDQEKRLNKFFDLKVKTGNTFVERPREFWTGQVLNALTNQTERDMDQYACSEAIDCMQAYYNVALKVLVDNYAVLAIEQSLLAELPDMFSPQMVMTLEEKTVQEIAAESAEAQAERAQVTSKLDILKKGLQSLNRLNLNRPTYGQFEDVFDEPSVADTTSITEESSVNEDRVDAELETEEDAEPEAEEDVEYDIAEATEPEEAREPEIDTPKFPHEPENFEVSVVPDAYEWPKQNHLEESQRRDTLQGVLASPIAEDREAFRSKKDKKKISRTSRVGVQ